MWWKNRAAIEPAVEKLREIIGGGTQRVARQWEDRCYDLVLRTDSPIEGILLAALYKDHHLHPFSLTFAGRVSEPEPFVMGRVTVYQQALIPPYRVDFLIDDCSSPQKSNHRLIVVECDGHDFHERTKEQARRDKARDRFLQSVGCRVLRFIGSEIWAESERCAAEIWAQLSINDKIIAGAVGA